MLSTDDANYIAQRLLILSISVILAFVNTRVFICGTPTRPIMFGQMSNVFSFKITFNHLPSLQQMGRENQVKVAAVLYFLPYRDTGRSLSLTHELDGHFCWKKIQKKLFCQNNIGALDLWSWTLKFSFNLALKFPSVKKRGSSLHMRSYSREAGPHLYPVHFQHLGSDV